MPKLNRALSVISSQNLLGIKIIWGVKKKKKCMGNKLDRKS